MVPSEDDEPGEHLVQYDHDDVDDGFYYHGRSIHDVDCDVHAGKIGHTCQDTRAGELDKFREKDIFFHTFAFKNI